MFPSRRVALLLALALASGLGQAGCTSEPEKQPVPAAGTSPGARRFSVPVLPSSESEQNRLARVLRLADQQPTGWYAPAGTAVTIEASLAEGLPEPEITIGTPGPSAPRRYPVKASKITVTDPAGGPIHVRYLTGTVTATAPPVTITIGHGAVPMPLAVLGATTPQQWKDLVARTEAPVAQLRSRYVVLTVPVATARDHAGEDVTALLTAYDELVTAQDALGGQAGDSLRDRVSPLLTYVVEGQAAAAADEYVTWPASRMSEVLTVAGVRRSWALWSEFGHLREQQAWEWKAASEPMAGLYALAVERAWKAPPRLTAEGSFAKAEAYLRKPAAERDYNALAASDPGTALVMFEQLRLGYGDKLFHRLHQGIRQRLPDPQDERTRMAFFQISASTAAGADLSGFFTAWGLPSDDRVAARIAGSRLTVPVKDLTTLRY
ncbi:M60 family metallopeptidase [Longispora albida]|uniref:M60 family metallopeptidase n=1 Tax=Longispora albida TaxID=203523 RepID=UPI00058B8D15|nr:M60 family metallopeptidase [Longispora albida]